MLYCLSVIFVVLSPADKNTFRLVYIHNIAYASILKEFQRSKFHGIAKYILSVQFGN